MNWDINKIIDAVDGEASRNNYDLYTTNGRIYIFKCSKNDGLYRFMPEVVGTLHDDGYFTVKWNLINTIDSKDVPYYDGFCSIADYMQDAGKLSQFLLEFDAEKYSE